MLADSFLWKNAFREVANKVLTKNLVFGGLHIDLDGWILRYSIRCDDEIKKYRHVDKHDKNIERFRGIKLAHDRGNWQYYTEKNIRYLLL